MADPPTSHRRIRGTQARTTKRDTVSFLLLQLHTHSHDKVAPCRTRASVLRGVPLMLRGHSKRNLNLKGSLHHNKCNKLHNPSPRRRTCSHIRQTTRGHRTILRRNHNKQTLPCSWSRHHLKVRVSPRTSSRPRSHCSRTHNYSTPSSKPSSSPTHNCNLPSLRPPFTRSPRRRAWHSNNLTPKPRRRTHLLTRPPSLSCKRKSSSRC
jgi:hypothetical protein